MTNPLQQFIFVLLEPPSPVQVEALLDGCADATVEVGPESAWVAFDREAPSLVDAIVSGVRDLTVARIRPAYVRVDDDLVTADIVALRSGRTRGNVVKLAARQDFPAQVAPRVYSWGEVAVWLNVHFGHTWADTALTMHAVNLALELRALMPRIERGSGIRAVLWS
jgi:hypothetical protein